MVELGPGKSKGASACLLQSSVLCYCTCHAPTPGEADSRGLLRCSEKKKGSHLVRLLRCISLSGALPLIVPNGSFLSHVGLELTSDHRPSRPAHPASRHKSASRAETLDSPRRYPSPPRQSPPPLLGSTDGSAGREVDEMGRMYMPLTPTCPLTDDNGVVSAVVDDTKEGAPAVWRV